jgi:hypothetical protein
MRSDSKRVVSTTMYFKACSLFGICKICRCEDLANFNHVAIFGGTFLHQSNEPASTIQYPPKTSFASTKGPSVTLVLPLLKETRAPVLSG